MRKARETWRPIVRAEAKRSKKQTTITSLSGVVSLDEIMDLRDDLTGLINAYDNGTPLKAYEFKMVSLAKERVERRKAKARDLEEQELSDDDSESAASLKEQSGTTRDKSSVDRSSGTSSVSKNCKPSSSSPTLMPGDATSSASGPSLYDHICTMLTRLENVRISLETLERTMIGKTLKRLTKKLKNSKKEWPKDISSRAESLVKQWKCIASDGLSRRKRRAASGIDKPVVPHWKKAKLDYHFRRQ